MSCKDHAFGPMLAPIAEHYICAADRLRLPYKVFEGIEPDPISPFGENVYLRIFCSLAEVRGMVEVAGESWERDGELQLALDYA